jgi:hypothetical protein
MVILKQFLSGFAGLAVLAAGISLFAQRADAIHCVPTAIPPGYYPTGVPCSLGCESDLHRNNSGATFCVVYGPGLPGGFQPK